MPPPPPANFSKEKFHLATCPPNALEISCRWFRSPWVRVGRVGPHFKMMGQFSKTFFLSAVKCTI